MECEIVPSVSVDDTVDAYGLCDTLVSDNASCFTANQFKKKKITPYHSTTVFPIK